jgi:uncharacterized protein (TIGR00730 family)
MNQLNRICVFCGSNEGKKEIYGRQTRALALELARRRIDLVYGGGSIGLMGILARTMVENSRGVLGIIPEALALKELSGQMLGELKIVSTMHERKALMARMADAFIALPGGLGTLDELFEIMTWGQLGIHRKPIGLLNIDGYFNPLLDIIGHAVEEGFVRSQHTDLAVVDDDPASLLERLVSYQAPAPMAQGLNWDQT